MIARRLLQRIARRCPVHDRAWPSRIRRLEASLDLEPIEAEPVSLVDALTDPDLIDCGLQWCRTRARPRG